MCRGDLLAVFVNTKTANRISFVVMLTLHDPHRRTRGFSLVELLVVISILAVLAALLFPVFLTARGKAREVVCISNLRQIGVGLSMYTQDNDGYYPYAIDAIDRFGSPPPWGNRPAAQAQIANMKMLHEVLQPYLQSKEIFRCPSDGGYRADDFSGSLLETRPSGYEKYGSSYYYRTELAFSRASESSLLKPAQTNVMFDPVGQWHGTLIPLMQRYNVLFADLHVKNIDRMQVNELWGTPLSGN